MSRILKMQKCVLLLTNNIISDPHHSYSFVSVSYSFAVFRMGEAVADPRGSPCPPPVFFGFFLNKSEVYDQVISIIRVQNLSQIVGNGHFGDSNFQKHSGEARPRRSLVPPPLKVLDPPLALKVKVLCKYNAFCF